MIERDDLAAAGRVLRVRLTDAERDQALETVSHNADALERLRCTRLDNSVPPATLFAPWLLAPTGPSHDAPSGQTPGGEAHGSRLRSPAVGPGPLRDDEGVAFASIRAQRLWILGGKITSTELTRLYLDRLPRENERLHCVISFLGDLALEQARVADREIAEGIDRGPLHGIPYGLKDIIDTHGIATTWGATPYRDRVPDRDAWVTTRLAEAGAVLLAKLSCGALAYGDLWFGGRTRNPWDPESGSSGSSAGSASAVAAGLVGFAIGTETYGSIVSPSMVCGTVGLRPTIGTVPRTGAMALSTTFDKIGPIARYVDDALDVLAALAGADAGDPESVLSTAERARRGAALSRSPSRSESPAEPGRLDGLVIGYVEADLDDDGFFGHGATIVDALARAGARMQPVVFPDVAVEDLMMAMIADAASHQQEITLDDLDDLLVWQDDSAWPNTFRSIGFMPAVDYVQAQRLRTLVVRAMHEFFAPIDAFVGPTFKHGLVAATNLSGHPALVVPVSLSAKRTPQAISLCGRWFEEPLLVRVARVLERHFSFTSERP